MKTQVQRWILSSEAYKVLEKKKVKVKRQNGWIHQMITVRFIISKAKPSSLIKKKRRKVFVFIYIFFKV